MYRIYGTFVALTFIAVTLPTFLLAVVLPGQSRRRRLVKASAALIFRLIGAVPRVSGLENLPDGPCVAVANHCSYLDGIVLTAVLPPQFTFVIKREMTQVPFANFLLQRIGSEFVERFDRSRGAVDARRIFSHAAQRQSLAFFPEGTFGPDPGLKRFHNGAFVAALRGEMPVTPIVIRGTREMLRAHTWLARPGSIEVLVKPAINFDAATASAKHLKDLARTSILDDLNEPDLTN
jgi:1-acyl-sn-glycerol-3-phosphate acyltransferase